VLESLIQCGAFDSTGVYRSRLFSALDDVLKFSGTNHDPNQLNMFGTPDLSSGISMGLFDFPEIDEWSEKELLRKEKEALGFYITGHPLAGFGREIERVATCVIQELINQKDKSQVKVAGVVEELKLKRTRRGDKMAVLRVEDLTGSTEVIIFPELFNKTAPLLKGDEPLFISGSAEIGDNSAKIIAQEIATLNAIRQKAVRAIEVRLEQEEISQELLEDIRDVVFRFPGKCRLLFKVDGPGGEELIIAADDRFSVLSCRELIEEIEILTETKVREIL
jgi:DNA polymerase-3 subunit alpha